MRRGLLWTVAWSAGTAAVFAAAAPAAAQQADIEGIVFLAGRTPAGDAEVSVAGLGRRVRVDGNGRFSFANIPVGTWVLEAISPRWGRAVQAVAVPTAGTVRVELVLESVFHLDEIVVSAGAGTVQRSEAYQPASVVTSRDLVALGEASLGETLSSKVGVNSTYFGPGASRPIIRGIGGDRVRILEGGVGVGDASSTSPDHAVGLDARSADRIEVLRGPATLLYGSSAVGGVVNVLDAKIARERPTRTLSGYVEALGGTVADERTGSAGLSALAGDLVVTGSGLWRNASDYDIPGSAGRGRHPTTASGEGSKVLENSALDTRRGALGLGYVGDRGYLGVAWSGIQSDYGVPGTDGTVIELEQTRMDLEGTLRMRSGAIRDLKVRIGVADYRHVELEGDEVGTTFLNDYVEGRLDSQHRLGERTGGAVGAQFSFRDFEAIGDEAFVPPSTTGTLAMFAYEGLAVSETFRLQAGVRFERQRAKVDDLGVDRSDDALSASAGLSWDWFDAVGFSLSLSRSVKLPNAEEMFSNGPHAATRAFEIGDPDLGKENALGADLTAHVHADRLRGTASFFTTAFADYIHERATGAETDGLTVFRFVQGDARFTGLELEGEVDLIEGDLARGRPHVSVEFLADYVSAKLTDRDEDLPRIPPMRYGGGINFRQGALQIRGSARHTNRQARVAPFEAPTPGFTMVQGSVSYRLHFGNIFHDITLVGSNLTDTEARLHTSFLKDVAPLPGRELRFVYRVNF
ncbi:MAG: TonB-dependent receptor [Longimicrobiales bacterium]|nr:TonB-dependent receptor [Longimicrobiales bacterium]